MDGEVNKDVRGCPVVSEADANYGGQMRINVVPVSG